MEVRLRDEYILQMMRIGLDDPAYERKAAYYKGAYSAVVQLWSNRDRIRKGHTKKENENADEKTEDNDESD